MAGCAVDRPRLPFAVILSFPDVVPIESHKNARKQDKASTSLIVLENIYRVRRRRVRTIGFLEILLLPLLLPAINPLSYRHVRITAYDSYVRVLRHALNGVISTSIVVRQPVNQPENDAAR